RPDPHLFFGFFRLFVLPIVRPPCSVELFLRTLCVHLELACRSESMEYITQFVDFFLHLDKYLEVLVQQYGMWTYLVLFVIVFCETGLVVTPILPGDSLLFAAGAIAAISDALNPHYLVILLTIAAI